MVDWRGLRGWVASDRDGAVLERSATACGGLTNPTETPFILGPGLPATRARKRREAGFIDSRGVLVDLPESVAGADAPVNLRRLYLQGNLSKARARGFYQPSTPVEVSWNVVRENLPGNL